MVSYRIGIFVLGYIYPGDEPFMTCYEPSLNVPVLYTPTPPRPGRTAHLLRHIPGWEKLYTADGVPFWTNHNERTTSWDPPATAGVVSEAQGLRQPSMESSTYESSDKPGVAAVMGVSVTPAEPRQYLAADGRPLPEGEVAWASSVVGAGCSLIAWARRCWRGLAGDGCGLVGDGLGSSVLARASWRPCGLDRRWVWL